LTDDAGPKLFADDLIETGVTFAEDFAEDLISGTETLADDLTEDTFAADLTEE